MKNDPVKILKELVRFPTFQVEPDKIAEGMKECSGFLEKHLESLGFEVAVDALYSVTAEKRFDGKGTFLVNTHFDTVPPSSEWKDALFPKIEDRRLYAVGSSDAKGGIASTLSALYELKDCRFEKLIIQFVNYEDNAVKYKGERRLGMPYFLQKNPDFRADYGINIEPTVEDDRFSISVGCTGRVRFEVKTIGKEAHSSTPKAGVNAIYHMAKVIEKIREIPPGRFKIDDFEAEMPINVAEIHGGRMLTIVPGECTINCERRVFPGEDPEQIKETIRSALSALQPEIEFHLEFGPKVQLPYQIDKSEYVVSLIADSAQKTVGYRPDIRVNVGRTDSMYLYHIAGVKTVIMGPGQTGVCHKTGEYINVDRLKEFTDLMKTLLSKES
ncbi:MAG: M20 family metallopeptidase [Candidatus Hodarchaeota archaeon]